MEQLQPLIVESVQLLLLGMGTVFIILTMLIFLISFSSKFLARYEDEPPHVSAPVKPRTPANQVAAANDSQLVAVISSAISAYKKRHSEK
ncbi:MAG: OadG family protein [Gammaproteobacteria bacterium]|nr:OadG family protein [Gammaproteobacteria bacterium]